MKFALIVLFLATYANADNNKYKSNIRGAQEEIHDKEKKGISIALEAILNKDLEEVASAGDTNEEGETKKLSLVDALHDKLETAELNVPVVEAAVTAPAAAEEEVDHEAAATDIDGGTAPDELSVEVGHEAGEDAGSDEDGVELEGDCGFWGFFSCGDLCELGCGTCYCGAFEFRWSNCGCEDAEGDDGDSADGNTTRLSAQTMELAAPVDAAPVDAAATIDDTAAESPAVDQTAETETKTLSVDDSIDVAAVINKRTNSRDDVKQALNMYFDALQVVLGYVPPPSDQEELKQMMAPFSKEVQWALGVMHPGFDKDLVNDEVFMKQLSKNNVGTRKQKENNDRKLSVDSDMCLEKTRDILSVSMRLAYYGLYGDLHSSDVNIQNSGRNLAEQLDVEEARELFKSLGPLRKGEDEFRLIAKEAFKYAESELGLDGIINYGMKSWEPKNFWAAGFFASEMWASALQINVFDTFPISSQTFANPDTTLEDTVFNEFSALVDDYNQHCATCPTGWTDNGITNHGLHCTTGFSPSCEGYCLQAECEAAKGKWAEVNLEFNPYTCYLSVCPSGWNNLGYKDDGRGLMCTMTRLSSCDESCAQVQCQNVGGSFPLAIDDVADNPYVCYV